MSVQSQMLELEYQLRFTKSAKYREAVWDLLCRDFFQKYISPDASVLDLGCGWGEFINHIQAARKFAMDLNPASQRLLQPGTRFLHQDCSQKWDIPSESLDVVFTSNFLEHLPGKFSVEQTAREAFRCLKPDGQLICMGPNIRFLSKAYWDFWDHVVPISDFSLAELLRMQGFHIQKQVARFMPYSMSLSSAPPPLFLARLYLKMPLLWPLFGRQFFIVAQKTSGASS